MDTLTDIILTKEELQALQLREDIIMSKKIETNLLQNERDILWLSLVKKYNLDEKKVYDVNKEGKISEKK